MISSITVLINTDGAIFNIENEVAHEGIDM